MNIQKVTEQYRLSQWMQVIQEKNNSGQNIKDFCQDKGISPNAYFYWQRKIRKNACVQLVKQEEHINQTPEISEVPQGWLQLTQNQDVKSTLGIEVAGCRITVDSTTDPELLKKVCRILREV